MYFGGGSGVEVLVVPFYGVKCCSCIIAGTLIILFGGSYPLIAVVESTSNPTIGFTKTVAILAYKQYARTI